MEGRIKLPLTIYLAVRNGITTCRKEKGENLDGGGEREEGNKKGTILNVLSISLHVLPGRCRGSSERSQQIRCVLMVPHQFEDRFVNAIKINVVISDQLSIFLAKAWCEIKVIFHCYLEHT